MILSIPFPAIAALPTDLFDDLADNVPVIDTGNYYPGMRDPSILEIDEGKAESVWVAERWVSIPSTQDRWPTPGGSSRPRPCTAATTTPRPRARRWPKPCARRSPASAMSPSRRIMAGGGNLTHDDLITINRELNPLD